MDDHFEDKNIPDGETCQKLIEEFESITGTTQALAELFLRDGKWKLEKALNAFYQSQEDPDSNTSDDSEVLITFDSSDSSKCLLKETTKCPNQFRLLSWNVDGLDPVNLKKRTKAVAKLIEIGNYDVVFLQEVVPSSISYLEQKFPHYLFTNGNEDGYFVITMLKRMTVSFDSSTVHNFPNSSMGRNLLQVDAHIGGLKLRLLNTHLESTAEFSSQRKIQLSKAITHLMAGTSEHASILAGDLNVRDKEIQAVELPEDVSDLWVQCGSRKECEYTWDLRRNTNKSMPGKFQPQLRFDRAYLYQSEPLITPNYFGLVGIQKILGTDSFPSDHWGIRVFFEINNGTEPEHSPGPSDDTKICSTLSGKRRLSESSPQESKFQKIVTDDLEICASNLEESLEIVDSDTDQCYQGINNGTGNSADPSDDLQICPTQYEQIKSCSSDSSPEEGKSQKMSTDHLEVCDPHLEEPIEVVSTNERDYCPLEVNENIIFLD